MKWNDIFYEGDGYYLSYLDLPTRMKEANLPGDYTDETGLVIENGPILVLIGDQRAACEPIKHDLEKLKKFFSSAE